ncbi:MAG: hypothetical protein ACHQE6_04665 [Solirubrobacterales bacterium]
MRIKITLAVGLALTAIAVSAVLRHSPLTVAATNGVQAASGFGVVRGAGAFCQPGETLPRGISAIRLSFAATTGPRIAVTVSSGSHVITGGTIGSGWYGSAVTVPVQPLRRPHPDVTICARFDSLTGAVVVAGEHVGAAPGRDGFVPGRLGIAYLRPGGGSWWSRAGSVIDHLALGRAASGRWIVLPIVALIAAAIALASVALTRELR